MRAHGEAQEVADRRCLIGAQSEEATYHGGREASGLLSELPLRPCGQEVWVWVWCGATGRKDVARALLEAVVQLTANQ